MPNNFDPLNYDGLFRRMNQQSSLDPNYTWVTLTPDSLPKKPTDMAKLSTKRVKCYNDKVVLERNAVKILIVNEKNETVEAYASARDQTLVRIDHPDPRLPRTYSATKYCIVTSGCKHVLRSHPNLVKCHITGDLDYAPEMTALIIGENMKTALVKRSIRGRFVQINLSNGNEYFFETQALVKKNGFEPCKYCSKYGKKGEKHCSCYRTHQVSYHGLTRHSLAGEARFRFGMEVEKEDGNVLQTLYAIPMYHETRWCIENDGSLGSGGFEAVSPILNLMDDKMIGKHLSIAKAIINAKYSSNCGGHIHVSDRTRNTSKLFDDCAGYFPLLYALYPKRCSNRFSAPAKKDRLKGVNKGAIMMHEKTVEFRIFPSPKNIKTQWWRIKLLRIIVENPRADVRHVIDDMLNTDSELFKHLTTEYDSLNTYLPKVRLVVDKAISIEGINLNYDELLPQELRVKEVLKAESTRKVENDEQNSNDENASEVPVEIACGNDDPNTLQL